MTITFEAQRALALAILSHGERLNRRSGSFLGQLATDDAPLSPKQQDWLRALAVRADLEDMLEAANG